MDDDRRIDVDDDATRHNRARSSNDAKVLTETGNMTFGMLRVEDILVMCTLCMMCRVWCHLIFD